MFQVWENTYTHGSKTPTTRSVAKLSKEGKAKAMAEKLNRSQDSVPLEQGIKTYYVNRV